jgi:threonylcarbamoyladenosine tRNA methylthiotransferase MtaB
MTTFYIEQFGCRATQADGAAIERQLLERGCTLASSASVAQIVVVNTCTVTASADTQARDAIRKVHALNPLAKVIVTGCYAQRAPEELAMLPGVSWVVGNSHKPLIPDLITENLRAGISPASKDFLPDRSPDSSLGLLDSVGANTLTGDIGSVSDVLVAPVLGGEGNHTRPTLKIQDGCNSRCAFCVIPFVRGKSRSLPTATVIGELNRLAASGFREVVLSGINLGTWGRDLNPRLEFIELLRKLLVATSVEQIRISSIEPMDVTQDLVDLFAGSSRIAKHFHIPLQSGSDRILAAMHRWYRTEHYARRIEMIRERLPHAAIGADVIAGFPGENEEDHAETLAFIDRLSFTYLHVFSYSPRPGTRAASLPNQLPGRILKRRARELRALGEAKASNFRRSQLGRTLRVLTLHRDANYPDYTPALSSNFLRVLVPGSWPSNQWLGVHPSEEVGNALLSELVDTQCDSCAPLPEELVSPQKLHARAPGWPCA